MRRAFTIIAIGLAITGPAGAAEKISPASLKLVARIDSLIATENRAGITIQAKGAVDSGGWTAARLRAVKSADPHTIVVEFVAAPPAPGRAVIEGLVPVMANARMRPRRGIISVRAVSGANEITSQILK